MLNSFRTRERNTFLSWTSGTGESTDPGSTSCTHCSYPDMHRLQEISKPNRWPNSKQVPQADLTAGITHTTLSPLCILYFPQQQSSYLLILYYFVAFCMFLVIINPTETLRCVAIADLRQDKCPLATSSFSSLEWR